jgi:hypothetical protein
MSKKDKKSTFKDGVEYRPAIHTDWAIMNKDTGMCLALFNPEGSIPALRRAGIAVAKDAGLSFTKVTLLPIGMMSPEKLTSSKVFESPRVVDPKASK